VRDAEVPSSEEAKWTVLLANAGAAIMTAQDIVEAYRYGTVNQEAKLWREGLTGWKSLWEVAPVATAFKLAGIALPSVESRNRISNRPDIEIVEEPTMTGHFTGTQPLGTFAPRTVANHTEGPRIPPTNTPWDDGDGFLGEDDPTRVAPSPWSVPDSGKNDAGAPSQKAPALHSHPTNTPAITAEFNTETRDAPLAVKPVGRGPRDTLRGQLSTQSTPPPFPPEAPSAQAPQSNLSTVVIRESPLSERAANNDLAFLPPAAISGAPLPRQRHRGRKILLGLGVIVLLSAAATVSYRTQQPRALYAYLQKRHWDIPLDRQVNRFVVTPYRAVVRKAAALLRR
jgi:hypothetical protein